MKHIGSIKWIMQCMLLTQIIYECRRIHRTSSPSESEKWKKFISPKGRNIYVHVWQGDTIDSHNCPAQLEEPTNVIHLKPNRRARILNDRDINDIDARPKNHRSPKSSKIKQENNAKPPSGNENTMHRHRERPLQNTDSEIGDLKQPKRDPMDLTLPNENSEPSNIEHGSSKTDHIHFPGDVGKKINDTGMQKELDTVHTQSILGDGQVFVDKFYIDLRNSENVRLELDKDTLSKIKRPDSTDSSVPKHNPNNLNHSDFDEAHQDSGSLPQKHRYHHKDNNQTRFPVLQSNKLAKRRRRGPKSRMSQQNPNIIDDSQMMSARRSYRRDWDPFPTLEKWGSKIKGFLIGKKTKKEQKEESKAKKDNEPGQSKLKKDKKQSEPKAKKGTEQASKDKPHSPDKKAPKDESEKKEEDEDNEAETEEGSTDAKLERRAIRKSLKKVANSKEKQKKSPNNSKKTEGDTANQLLKSTGDDEDMASTNVGDEEGKKDDVKKIKNVPNLMKKLPAKAFKKGRHLLKKHPKLVKPSKRGNHSLKSTDFIKMIQADLEKMTGTTMATPKRKRHMKKKDPANTKNSKKSLSISKDKKNKSSPKTANTTAVSKNGRKLHSETVRETTIDSNGHKTVKVEEIVPVSPRKMKGKHKRHSSKHAKGNSDEIIKETTIEYGDDSNGPVKETTVEHISQQNHSRRKRHQLAKYRRQADTEDELGGPEKNEEAIAFIVDDDGTRFVLDYVDGLLYQAEPGKSISDIINAGKPLKEQVKDEENKKEEGNKENDVKKEGNNDEKSKDEENNKEKITEEEKKDEENKEEEKKEEETKEGENKEKNEEELNKEEKLPHEETEKNTEKEIDLEAKGTDKEVADNQKEIEMNTKDPDDEIEMTTEKEIGSETNDPNEDTEEHKEKDKENGEEKPNGVIDESKKNELEDPDLEELDKVMKSSKPKLKSSEMKSAKSVKKSN